MLNFLSQSSSYNPDNSRLWNFGSQLAKNLTSILPGGAIGELVSRIMWAKTKCSPKKAEMPECKQILPEISMIAGYITTAGMFADPIIGFLLDNPRVTGSVEKSKAYLKCYESFKSFAGSMPFYMLAVMAAHTAAGKDDVDDGYFWCLEFFAFSFLPAIFSNPQLRERLRLWHGGGQYMEDEQGRDPRGITAKIFEGFFGACNGFAMGRGFIAIVDNVLRVFSAEFSGIPDWTRWGFGGFIGVLQAFLDSARSPAAPAFFQGKPAWQNKVAWIPQAVTAAIMGMFFLNLFNSIGEQKSPHKEGQLFLGAGGILLALGRSILSSYYYQPPAASPLLKGDDEDNSPGAPGGRSRQRTVTASPSSSSKEEPLLLASTALSVSDNSPAENKPAPRTSGNQSPASSHAKTKTSPHFTLRQRSKPIAREAAHVTMFFKPANLLIQTPEKYFSKTNITESRILEKADGRLNIKLKAA
jgi:hypothetical protein